MGQQIPSELIPPEFKEIMDALEQQVASGLDELAVEFADHPELFSGQKPKYALVACSDSRIKLDAIFEGGIGKAFKFRNIGNSMEMPGDPNKLSEQAEDFLTYATHVLKVPTLIIKGHGACGCIANALKCSQSPPLAADADLTACILRRMGDSKRFIVDMIPTNEEAQSFLREHDLPGSDLPDEKPRLKALEVMNAIHMAKLSREFLAEIKSSMKVVVAHFDIASCSFYFSVDGEKFRGVTPSVIPGDIRAGAAKSSRPNGVSRDVR